MPLLILLIVMLWLAAGACTVAGLLLLAGLGWSLVAAGAFLAVTAAILKTGVTPNG